MSSLQAKKKALMAGVAAIGGAGGPFDKASVTVTTNKAINDINDNARGIFMTPDNVAIVWGDGVDGNRLSLFDPTDFTSIDTTQRYNISSFQISPFFGGCADNTSMYLFGLNNSTTLVVWSTDLDATTINWGTDINLSGSESYPSNRYHHITVDDDYVWVATTEQGTRSKEIVVLHQLDKATGDLNWSREYYMNSGGSHYNVRSIDVDFKGNCYFTGEYASRGVKKINSSGTIVWEKEISSPPIDGQIGGAWLDDHYFAVCVYSGDMVIVKMDDSDGSVVDDISIEVESGFSIKNTFDDGSNGLVTKNENEIIACAPRSGASPNRFYQMFIAPDLTVNHSSRLESSIGNPINGSIGVAATGNDGVAITCQSGGNYVGILNTDGDGGGDQFTSVTEVTSAVSTATATVSAQSNGSLSPTETSVTVTNATQSNPSIRNWTGI